MVEKMPWGTREKLDNGWWVDSPGYGGWKESGGFELTDPRYVCRQCNVSFASSGSQLVFKATLGSNSYHCERCARKVGIIW